MAHTLYAIHGSHPCATVIKALELKRQPYRVVELVPAAHVPLLWWRFRHRTVPALVLGSGEEVVGSRAIVHRLDELVPTPALLPADPTARSRVEAAERWGDEVLQAAVRRLFWMAIKRRPDAIATYSAGSRLPLPAWLQRASAPVIGALARWVHRADEATLRADLAALPGQLDHVDRLIADGVLGGDEPNAADVQIAPSIRMLGTFADVRPLLDGRPAWALAQRLFPHYDGAMPAGALPL